MEIIDKEGIHTYDDPEEACEYLKNNPADLRIDLHGVLDILSPSILLDSFQKVVCISYVGSPTSPIYKNAQADIQERIHSGQIVYSVLVFRRGRGPGRHTFVETGSKAWVNHHIGRLADHCVFIDDSMDHLRSTFALCPDLMCLQFNLNSPTHLLAMIQRFAKGKHPAD
jgi:hypothetical protein